MRPTWLLVLCFLPPVVFAEGFYERRAEGWFFYADPPPEAGPPPPDPPPEPPPPPPAPASAPSAEAASGPPPLSVAWLREQIPVRLEAAIDDPTPDNVRLYHYLKRIAYDKSEAFARVSQQVVEADPRIDENARRPVASFAAREASRLATGASREIMAGIAAQAGILFFYRSDCPFCHLQAPLLRRLQERYGFTVYPVALDGLALPDGLYPDYAGDAGLADQLGVVTVPALFLVRPPADVLAIGQGVLSIDQIEERVLGAAAAAGWIDETAFAAARGVSRAAPLHADGAGLTPEVLEDSRRLIEFLRAGGQ